MADFPPLFRESKPSPAGTVDVETPSVTHKLDSPQAIRFRYVEVTPEMAEEWLTRNLINRNIRKSTVAQLAKTMQSNEWRLTAETLKFDRQGVLLDGQHRLLAIIESGMTVPFHVCEGLASDVKRHLDTGSKRSFRDVLKMDREDHPTVLAGAAVWVFKYFIRRMDLNRFSHEECDGIIRQCPELREFCQYAFEIPAALCPRALGVALYYLCARKDADRADAFFDGLATNLRIENTPIHFLRERLLKEAGNRRGRFNNVTRAAFIIKAWNAYVTGEPLTKLAWNKADGFPFIIGDEESQD